MKTANIAFDVDGTLRCDCTPDCSKENFDITTLLSILNTFDNITVWVWSGGGADYAYQFVRKFRLPVPKSRCISKIGAPKMDMAIDDEPSFNLATLNLISKGTKK